jgi:hypothetical protein
MQQSHLKSDIKLLEAVKSTIDHIKNPKDLEIKAELIEQGLKSK